MGRRVGVERPWACRARVGENDATIGIIVVARQSLQFAFDLSRDGRTRASPAPSSPCLFCHTRLITSTRDDVPENRTSEPSVFSAHDPPQFRTQRLLPLSVIAFASRHHIRVRSLQEHQSLFHASLYALVDHHALQLTHRAVHVPVRAHVHADALGFAPDLAASRRGRRGVPKNPERGETPTGVAERRRAIGGPKRALRRGRASRRGRRGPRRARSRRPSSRRERRETAEGPRQTPNQLVHGASASVTARWVPQGDGSSGAPVSDGQHARIDAAGDFFRPIACRYLS